MTYFGSLGFMQPWFLVALFALPVLWYLLRLIPPQPATVWFPPLRLLVGLTPKDQTFRRSPWWLLLLRMLMLGVIIAAFARPVWDPENKTSSASLDMVIVIDNGWASAKGWEKRKRVLDNLLSRAEQTESPVLLAQTSFALKNPVSEDNFSFKNLHKIREEAAALEPQPYYPERLKLIKNLENRISRGKSFRVVWLSDGIDYGAADEFAVRMKNLAGAYGSFEIFNENSTLPLGLYVLPKRNGLQANIIRAGGRRFEGIAYAWNARGDRLGEAKYEFRDGQKKATAEFSFPHLIRNQVTRVTLSGEKSAGAVYLLDSRSLRYRVGLISGEDNDISQPLLSPLYYIEKALTPYAEVYSSNEKNVSVALDEVIQSKPSTLVMTDIGRLTNVDLDRLRQWIGKGGLLIRFAGPVMEKHLDQLLPVNIRRGGRNLGGALSWREPQGVAKFDKNSPFHGLQVPAEIRVKKQVLTDPSLRTEDIEVWAELNDGTPLVTAKKVGDGRLVFFHVTANSEWSNLPISGLFVGMLKRLTELSQPGLNSDPKQGGSDLAGKKLILAPYRVLNGFGSLVEPFVDARAVESSRLINMKPRYGTPPGYYGASNSTIALNIHNSRSDLISHRIFSKEASLFSYSVSNILLLFPWFILAAFGLLLLDSLIWLGMTRKQGRFLAHTAIVTCVVGILSVMSGSPVMADKKNSSELEFALKASTGTHLAYVITGKSEIDRISQAGLSGLSKVIASRTAVEPSDPIGVDLSKDDISFFPILYWPVDVDAKDLSDKVLAKVDAYMRLGGLILFDTRDYQSASDAINSGSSPAMKTLQRLFRKLNIPPLNPVGEGHVVTKSFYLLKNFPGRWEGGKLWAEASTNPNSSNKDRGRRADGVSSILITSNDFAGAWALDESYRPMLPTVPGGELQREMAFRSGVNIVMYALTGNYKADQVHVPALLERLGQ